MRSPTATQLQRRVLIRRSTLAASALLASAGWAGCASQQGGSSAQPAVAAPSTVLLASIPFQGSGNYHGIMQQLMEQFIAQNFSSQHPGVEVKTMAGSGANGTNQSAMTDVTSSIAGAQVPDTLCGCCSDIQTYLTANALLPLDTLLKQDNVNLSDFSPGHLDGLQIDGQQMALPQYDGPMVLTYNQDMLDQLGLPYPQANWSQADADKLWQSIAHTSKGKRIYGTGLDTGDPEWIAHSFGGAVGDATRTKCVIDSAGSISGFRWITNLLTNKVANSSGPSAVQGAQCGFAMTGGWDIQTTALWKGLKWDYLPMPTFPTGKPSTFINNDFNGINAYSKNPPDLVWALFKFITLNTTMQQFQFKTTFITPNRASLWPDWIQIVRAVAPPLQNKHLEYFQQAVDYGWPNYFFKYGASQASNIVGGWASKIESGKVAPQAALQQCVKQVDALEAAGASETPPAVEAKQFPTVGPEMGVLPAGI